jgi:phosphatidylserine synthase
MKKTHFTNQSVYWAIIAIIGGLLLWNLFATITTGKFIGLLPVTIQAVIIGLILTKNEYAKIGVKIWAIVFLAIASGLQFVGRLLQDAADNFENAQALHYITTGFTVLVGIMIVVYVNKTVEVVEIEK